MQRIKLMFFFQHDVTSVDYARYLLEQLNRQQATQWSLGYDPKSISIYGGRRFEQSWTDGIDGKHSFYAKIESQPSYVTAFNIAGQKEGDIGFGLLLSKSYFDKHKIDWEKLFRTVCETLRPTHATIGKDVMERSIYAYTLNHSTILEIEWLNYCSDYFLNEMERARLDSYSWDASFPSTYGTFYRLTERLHEKQLFVEFEKARSHIGTPLMRQRNVTQGPFQLIAHLHTSFKNDRKQLNNETYVFGYMGKTDTWRISIAPPRDERVIHLWEKDHRKVPEAYKRVLGQFDGVHLYCQLSLYGISDIEYRNVSIEEQVNTSLDLSSDHDILQADYFAIGYSVIEGELYAMTHDGNQTIHVFDSETYAHKSKIANVETLINQALEIVEGEYRQGTVHFE